MTEYPNRVAGAQLCVLFQYRHVTEPSCVTDSVDSSFFYEQCSSEVRTKTGEGLSAVKGCADGDDVRALLRKRGTNMKNAITLALLMLSAQATFAQSVPIEPSAIMSDQLSGALIDPSVDLIRAHGWKCDSISALIPFLISRGFSVTCNQSRYKYNFEDKGGNWVVSLD